MATLKVERDETGGFDPREDDNLGTMLCWHGRYRLGDAHRWSPEEIRDMIEGLVALPLYLYDHGVQSISVESFQHAEWDSGQAGWIVAFPERIEAMGTPPERIEAVLRAEVEEYDAWMRGEVWQWEVLDDDGEHVEGCGGYLGDGGKTCALEEGYAALKGEVC